MALHLRQKTCRCPRKGKTSIQSPTPPAFRPSIVGGLRNTPNGPNCRNAALGQKQTCAVQNGMSALPLKATSNETYGMSTKAKFSEGQQLMAGPYPAKRC